MSTRRWCTVALTGSGFLPKRLRENRYAKRTSKPVSFSGKPKILLTPCSSLLPAAGRHGLAAVERPRLDGPCRGRKATIRTELAKARRAASEPSSRKPSREGTIRTAHG